MSVFFHCALNIALLLLLVSTSGPSAFALPTEPAVGPTTAASVEARIEALVSQMSLDEKVHLIGGAGFETKPLPRLGIPALRLTDGPMGVMSGKSTAFPSGIAMGASFDPGLIEEIGAVIAEETRFKGRHMLLGPTVNISRQPFGGRNFESFGEDPLLTSRMGARYIKGIQSRNVVATVKHFAVNDQEVERMSIDTRVDPRTMFEIHLPAFKAAVDAGVLSVMSAYNKVNGHHASENDYLQNVLLKKEWGFEGFVVSDWFATHSTIEAANHGLDLEMPFGDHFNDSLIAAVREGKVAESTIDDKIRRILRVMFKIGLIDPSLAPTLPPAKGPDHPDHHSLARRAALESAVLLKNSGAVLPVDTDRFKKIAILGPNAAEARSGGGGSSKVTPTYVTTPLESLKELAGAKAQLIHAVGAPLPGNPLVIPAARMKPSLESHEEGLLGEFFGNTNLEGAPLFTRIDREIDFKGKVDPRLDEYYSVRWTGFVQAPVSGRYTLSTISDDGVRLFLDEREIIVNWQGHGPLRDSVDVDLEAGRWYRVRLEFYNGLKDARIMLGWELPVSPDVKETAVRIAKEADLAIVFAGLGNDLESEGYDRPTMELPLGQSALIDAVADANPNTVVVLYSGNPLNMEPWLSKVKAVMQVWYPGQEGGRAVAELLLGHANPSGKLPVTFLKKWEDSPAFGHYPGKGGSVEYGEGIFVGYRHFDTHGIDPLFAFGHGLSYTDFAYSKLRIQLIESHQLKPKVRVSFDVQNIGSRAGAEVAQLYVGEIKPTVPRPLKELKGFAKVRLEPGQTESVTIDLDASAFAYFDTTSMSWKANAARFRIEVGSSSRDPRLRDVIQLTR